MIWRVDHERSSLYVWTFKAGLMARMAHDLKIEVTDYDFIVDGELGEKWRAELTMPIEGFRVLGATRNKVLQEDQLSLDDKAEIEQTLRAKVLDAERYPIAFYRAHFSGDENQRNFDGQLTLKGSTRPLKIQGRMERTVQ
ncbi:MAG: YceI family protein, partial [Planctomycetota bacterium]|nr:YceI family protein [Planctomycetota bacterium]